MENDDKPVGHVLTRRQALTFLSAPALLWLTGCSMADASATDDPLSDTCVVRPELTEGPYYVNENLNRSDIRTDTSTGTVKPGTLLTLTFNVSRIAGNTCSPLENALVDVWHCDALGVYSDVSDPGFNTAGQDFLRGYQLTDAEGTAAFTTIYPGWYSGRAVHIHFKVRSSSSSSSAYAFTSQLFFDDTLSTAVHAQQPYASKGQRNTLNARDGIYARGGSQLLLDVAQTDEGYAAPFNIALHV